MRLLVIVVAILVVLVILRAVIIARGGALSEEARVKLEAPWQQRVQRAVRAQAQFYEIARNTRPGPLRNRLEGLSPLVDAAAGEATRVARIGSVIDPGDEAFGPAAIRLDDLVGTLERSVLAAAELALGTGAADDASLDRELQALETAVEEIRRSHPE